MSRVWIGLGSNLGDRLANLLEGLERLDGSDGVGVHRVSTIIETVPVGVRNHRAYLNAAAELEVELGVEEMVERCLEIERGLGRERVEDGAGPEPRSLDLDVLLFEDRVVDRPGVQVPHPRMQDRAFVLVPMVELCPELMHPVLGRTMQELLEHEIERFGPVERRCAILKPGTLLSDESVGGPAGLSPN